MSNYRQRRSRYTVTLSTGERKVILAYSAEGARNYYAEFYASMGITVTRVAQGDYRKQQHAANRQAQGGFTIDRQALAFAIEYLGLTWPVDIRTHARVGGTQGNHRLTPNHRHNIMVKSYLTPEEASSTLWHELTHAAQAERAGNYHAWSEFVREQRRIPYSHRSIEIEARQASKDMADYPLCK